MAPTGTAIGTTRGTGGVPDSRAVMREAEHGPVRRDSMTVLVATVTVVVDPAVRGTVHAAPPTARIVGVPGGRIRRVTTTIPTTAPTASAGGRRMAGRVVTTDGVRGGTMTAVATREAVHEAARVPSAASTRGPMARDATEGTASAIPPGSPGVGTSTRVVHGRTAPIARIVSTAMTAVMTAAAEANDVATTASVTTTAVVTTVSVMGTRQPGPVVVTAASAVTTADRASMTVAAMTIASAEATGVGSLRAVTRRSLNSPRRTRTPTGVRASRACRAAWSGPCCPRRTGSV